MNLRNPINLDSRIQAAIIFALFVLTGLGFVCLNWIGPLSKGMAGVLFFWTCFGQIVNPILAAFLVESYLRKGPAERKHGGWVMIALIVALGPLILGFIVPAKG